MLKLKLILAALFIPFLVFFLLFAWRLKEKHDYPYKMVLAKEIRKVMSRMMFDVREAKQASIREVPLDGQWHSRIAFDRIDEGLVEYVVLEDHLIRLNHNHTEPVAQYISSIRIRRPTNEADVLEIQIKAKKGVSLMSSFKIRVRN